jgi:hypothetical protein
VLIAIYTVFEIRVGHDELVIPYSPEFIQAISSVLQLEVRNEQTAKKEQKAPD